jgi:hypothetical protein
MARRSYGTGSLAARRDKRGRETWYARVRVGGRQLKKAIGPKREPGGRGGLTRRQAEARLRRLIEELERTPVVAERLTVEEIGTRYIQHLTALGRRRSTLQDYKSYLQVNLVPFFGELPLENIGRGDVEDFIAEKLGDGNAPKSVRNYLGLLHSLFAYAEKQEWTRGNPCKLVEQPGDDERDPDIRFLDDGELEALLRAIVGSHRLIGCLPDRRHDGSAARRAARVAVAGHRLGRLPRTSATQLRAWRVRQAEVQAFKPVRAIGRSRGGRARPPLSVLGLPGR